MVVLSASICKRDGKVVLSRQFREIARSRIEKLLAAFPKLADSGTQHTTVENDNVRYVYQPLDELYMVLITNRQSNILQDIDSLHLFAKVVTSITESLEEQSIANKAFEIISAFDEIITRGYRENISADRIITFLAMDSHEERIQDLITRNKESEASELRKVKAREMEHQRREIKNRGGGNLPRAPSFQPYNPPPKQTNVSSYDSYEAEKNKSSKSAAPKGKGMQLGKKSKATDMFDRVREELGVEAEDSAPLFSKSQPIAAAETAPTPRESTSSDREAIHVAIRESISAELSREGTLKSFKVSGDLQVRCWDPSLAKVKFDVVAKSTHNVQFKTNPHIDKAQFANKVIQLKNVSKGFPTDQTVGVLRWNASAPANSTNIAPLLFTVWVNKGSGSKYNLTVEYEASEEDILRDVVVTIPYVTNEPTVSSFEATYEVSGDTLEWTIGTIDQSNSSGSFEFEAEAEDDSEFFPMNVQFSKSKPFIEVDVTAATLVEMDQDIGFSKEIKSTADSYAIE